jgi:hypothetical protein
MLPSNEPIGHESTRGSRAAVALWLLGALFMATAIWFGTQVEDQLNAYGMGGFESPKSLIQHVAGYFFAFGFPVGVAICALATRIPLRRPKMDLWRLTAAATVLVTAPLLVPVLAGRGLTSEYFGAGGIVIALCAILTFFYLGKLRRTMPSCATGTLDLLVWGLSCFAVAAWNLCGSAAMPSHLLSPETVLRLGTLPFAIGQMKTVLALLAVGWMFVVLAARSALPVLTEVHGRGR